MEKMENNGEVVVSNSKIVPDDEMEIYNWNAKFPNSDEKTEYENKKNQFIETLKSNNEFAKKQAYRIKPKFFGESYSLEKSNLKLKDILGRTIASIRIYQNLLVFQTMRNTYAVKLTVNEEEKVFDIVFDVLALLKI